MNKTNAIVFPGQGSQRMGMGNDFYQGSATFRDIFQRSGNAISVDLADLCFNENEKLDQTEFTQPAILTLEVGMYELLKEKGLKADYFAGHSLGEYSALTCAGVFELEDSVRLVRKRGELMQRATPVGMGAMAAVILEDIENSTAGSIIKNALVEIANINSKDQWVVSGLSENIQIASEELTKQIEAVRVVPLTVSAPFHSSLMKSIESEFSDFLKSLKIKPQFCTKVLSNFSGTFHKEESLIDHLVKQISGTVRWVENMKKMIETGSTILEVGPNRPLGSFFQTLGVEVPSIINLRSFNKMFRSDDGGTK